jgi:two-component system response regulator YesN
LLSAAPVITLGVFSYHKASSSIQEKVKASNELLLLQTGHGLEQVLTSLDDTVTQFISSPFFNKSLGLSLNYTDFVNYQDLQEGIRRLQLSKYGINNTYVANLTYNWMISYLGLETFSESNMKDIFLQYAQMPYTSSWVTQAPKGDSSYSEYVSLVKKLPLLTNSTNPQGIIAIDINMNELKKMLSHKTELGSIIILDGNYRILLDQNQWLTNNQQATNELVHMLQENTSKTGYFKANLGETVGVTFFKSTYNRWTYLSIVSIKEITRESRDIGWFTFFICLVIFAVAAILSFLATRRMYSPVRKLYDIMKNSSTDQMNEKVKDEFSYMEQSFSTLLITRTQLKGEQQLYFPQLKEWFVTQLCRGQIKSSEMDNKLHQFGFPTTWNWLIIFTLQIDTLEGTHYEEADRDLLMFAINNMISELVAASERLSPVLIDRSQVTVIVSNLQTCKELKGYLNELADTIKEAIARYLKLKVSIGISRPFHHLEDTLKAYEEGLEALQYRIRLGSDVILYIDEVTPVQRATDVAYPTQIEKELLNALKMTEEAWTMELLRKFIEKVLEKEITHSEFQFVMGQLLFHLIEFVQGQGEFVRKVFEEKSIFRQLAELNTFEETENWFKHTVIKPAIQLLEQRRRAQEDNISNAVIRMIHEEFNTDLTLDVCATRMGFHPNYVSRVFKKELCMSFSDYLAQYRLKVSKQWLTETDLKINEIAIKLKYNSSAAFVRYFRKMEGMPPGQYREKRKQ